MSNTTPSEIADWLEFRAGRKEGGDNAEVNRILHGLDRQAAVTIRAQAEAIKTATEALEEIANQNDLLNEQMASEDASQALARIKEAS